MVLLKGRDREKRSIYNEPESDGDDGEHGGGAETGAGRRLLALLCLHLDQHRDGPGIQPDIKL